ncbi:hypothetical protein CEXT_510011 [Caerostris extrusa]|uniref:Uncharacterized protein n=1 Tax=Caerostris extrusa TaxID=172846 RepID=A0AAV4RY58_CAEEX|nr:hypothetical protein CEXT_510011 [Caerostris extrusa]
MEEKQTRLSVAHQSRGQICTQGHPPPINQHIISALFPTTRVNGEEQKEKICALWQQKRVWEGFEWKTNDTFMGFQKFPLNLFSEGKTYSKLKKP